MKKKALLLTLTLSVASIFLLLCGCGAKSSTINVNYAPLYLKIASKSSMPNAEKINLYAENFSDMRGNIGNNVIGEAKTGTFDKKTPILIDDGVIDLSSRTLRQAFSNQGFNMVKDENSADLVFKGRINRFWVQEILSSSAFSGSGQSEAEVAFDVALIDRVHAKTIWFDVKACLIKSGKAIDTTTQNEIAINEAFSKVITSIIHDEALRMAIRDFIKSKK